MKTFVFWKEGDIQPVRADSLDDAWKALEENYKVISGWAGWELKKVIDRSSQDIVTEPPPFDDGYFDDLTHIEQYEV